MEELESSRNGQEFCYLCRTPKNLKSGRDVKAYGPDVGAPVRVVGREKQVPPAIVGPLQSEHCLSLGGVDGTPAGVGVD